MRRKVLAYTFLIIGASLMVPTVPAWPGEIRFSEAAGQSILGLEDACAAKKMPLLTATATFPPDGVTRDDLANGTIDASVKCELGAFLNSVPVKGFRANVETSLVTISDSHTGHLESFGTMTLRTRASGIRIKTVTSGIEVAE